MAELPPARPAVRVADAVRVVSYNVRDLLDDRDAVAHVVRSCRPDVLCLQEAPRRLLAGRRLRRLARETALHWVSGGRASGGTAVLVHPRFDVVDAHAQRLAVGGLLARRRGFATATVRTPAGALLTVVSVHLSLRADERVRHVWAVLDQLPESGPVAVAGDLNEPPDGPSWAVLSARLHDAAGDAPAGLVDATYPARRPRSRIDAVFVSPDVAVVDVHVAGVGERLDAALLAAASDHLPVLAVLRLAGDDAVRSPL